MLLGITVILLMTHCSRSFPMLGQNILIGNSASFTNNHLEIFSLLKNVDSVVGD
jgi:hypothetical protein